MGVQVASHGKGQTSAWLRTGFGVAIGGLCLYLALRGVNYANLELALTRANRGYIGLALVSVAVNTIAKAARWKVLIGPAGRDVPLRRLLAALVVGHRAAIGAPICWGVGALFDYVTGVEPRAPAWMRAIALEWLWRLLIDPAGKWHRYVIGNPLFFDRVLYQWLVVSQK